jgi:uncharacterized protein (UPF0216 family)
LLGNSQVPRSLQDEVNQSHYERVLQESVRGELRIVNAGLPKSQKRLSNLLNEKYPNVVCHDGSTHSFKSSELEYLASMLDADERKALALPMLIELGSGQGEAAIMCEGGVEEKIISKVLDMPVTCEQRRIRIYKPQLALLRRKLKTTTVYLFSQKIVA